MIMETFGTALGSLNAAKDIVQAFDGVKTAAAVNGVKLELQRHLLEAYSGMMVASESMATLRAEKRQLEEEIMRLKSWEGEREKYELANLGTGAIVYVRKEGVEPAQAPHWLCAACFDNAQKAVLQPQGKGKDPAEVVWSCAAKHTVSIYFRTKPGR